MSAAEYPLVVTTDLEGFIGLGALRLDDSRGWFVKHLSPALRDVIGEPFPIGEAFETFSHRDVVRGLHFQAPPRPQAKLVVCIEGALLDTAVDLRVGSPTYGRHATLTLAAPAPEGGLVTAYVPVGFAHGFRVLSDHARVLYLASVGFDPNLDEGIHWGSAGVDWGIEHPIVSDRDAALPPLNGFESPFSYSTP